MGLGFSGLTVRTVKDEDGITKCVPRRCYQKFPVHRRRAAGDLIVEFPALPKQCYPGREPTNAYWWTDAQFLPYNDCSLFVTTTPYTPRSNRSWISFPKITGGRVLRYNLDSERLKCENFSHSGSSSFPKVQPHPSGEYIASVGFGAITIRNLLNEVVYNRNKDHRNPNFRFCSFSPNGKYIAVLSRYSCDFEMMILTTQTNLSIIADNVELKKLCKNFKGSTMYNEHVECKWSPDSRQVAISSSMSHLLLLSYPQLELVCSVFVDILADMTLSLAGCFDFDPRSCNKVLAVGTDSRQFCMVDTSTKEILFESEVLGTNAIDCIQYNTLGTQIAVGMRDFVILFHCSDTGDKLYEIDMKETCPDIKTPPSGPFPGIIRFSFSSTGEELAVTSCDGVVRIWQLRREISLKRLCKWVILGFVPPLQVQNLPLPNKIKNQLLFDPVIV